MTNEKVTAELDYMTLSLPDLFEKYSLDVFRYAKSILKESDEAKDAVQEVFLKYAKNEKSFKGNCSQKTWLLIIARNYCFNKIKNNNYKNISIDNAEIAFYSAPDFEMKISLEEALKLLSPEHNELLYLKEYSNYSYKEIAEITNQTVENVKIKLFRGRQILRKMLKNERGTL